MYPRGTVKCSISQNIYLLRRRDILELRLELRLEPRLELRLELRLAPPSFEPNSPLKKFFPLLKIVLLGVLSPSGNCAPGVITVVAAGVLGVVAVGVVVVVVVVVGVVCAFAGGGADILYYNPIFLQSIR